MAERIAIVSAERIRDELAKLLLAPYPRAGLTLLVDTGLAEHVLPELPALRSRSTSTTATRTSTSTPSPCSSRRSSWRTGSGRTRPGLRLAALMHDIGKPATRRFDGGR